MSEPVFMEFDNTDIKRNMLVEPAWYRIRVNEVEAPKVSAKGDSYNTVVKAVVIKNADTNDEKYEGVPLYINFNTKFKGAAIGFLEALGVEVKEAGRFDLGASRGMELEQFVGNRTYNDQLQNDPQHKYRPAK